MQYALAAILLVSSGLTSAQRRPQMTWEGYVGGSAVLYIQGDRVDSQGRDTGSVDRPRYKFATPLPPREQRVALRVRRGPGRVEILEQPVAENEYTAVVRIDPPSARLEPYSIEFYWNSSP